MGQIIYPKYALFIIIYAVIFLLIGVSIGRGFDIIFPKFLEEKDSNVEHKSKGRYIGEILLQIAAIVVSTYIFRELVHFVFEQIEILRVNNFGKPDRFAVLILAPTMFSVQPNLIKKIQYVWGLR